ncbi:MAG TPA: rod shape-determining protein RodA [Candidatus Aminicenantes bacterium]|nr:rod shape-determining protein RodA [Candidatus Aminicenantes bacterium]HRY65524.1 rod shape-determining protein RodA [Candidatus Aminicenantes bacterium]HRZ72588.1 rod shape-determining protein RodA [Candidatus Aminicenantes bacterium]
MMMIDRRHLSEIDWVLLGLVLLQSLIGAAFIYSSSHFLPGAYYVRQLVWIGVSIVALFLVLAVDYKFFVSLSAYFYGLVVALLALMLVFGRLVAGTKSWLTLGLMQFQPSEMAKIVMILVFARIFAEYKSPYLTTHHTLGALLIAGLPLLLIILQPDLGTAMTFVAIVGGSFILAGLKRKTIILLVAASLLLGIGGWKVGLKDYQKKRITVLINPSGDPRGSGYQVNQSKIAIGAGGLTGKGFTKGTQSQLRFLPARHTDFIFSVIGEETGFFGVLAVILLYFAMLARMFLAVPKARDRAGVYIVFTASLLIAFQFLTNVLMVVGLVPVVGITLPFLSYGGSSLLTSFIAVGLVLNVRMRRFANV